MEGLYLLIGIVEIVEVVEKGGIGEWMRIKEGNSVGVVEGNDEIRCIEDIEEGSEGMG